jgi:cyclophilin family peptidyl-prolyl cis-trans isomerase
MHRIFFGFFFTIFILSCKSDTTYTLESDLGKITIKIFDSTPKHQANFNKLVSEGFYDGLLFHRVIDGFMIQGGDPESKNAQPNQTLGVGGPGYTIPAEIAIPHFKGMISAARQGDDVNPQKESSGSQFFIVHGSLVTDQELNVMEKTKGFKYTPAQREKYKKIGGSPMLDGDYTVFGEVIEGLDVVDKLAIVPKDLQDRPIKDVKFKIYK